MVDLNLSLILCSIVLVTIVQSQCHCTSLSELFWHVTEIAEVKLALSLGAPTKQNHLQEVHIRIKDAECSVLGYSYKGYCLLYISDFPLYLFQVLCKLPEADRNVTLPSFDTLVLMIVYVG